MFKRGFRAAAMIIGLLAISPATQAATGSNGSEQEKPRMVGNYLEIVSNEVDSLIVFYQRVHGLCFGTPEPDLGNARVASQPDGTLIGIRKPMAEHEKPIVRSYVAVADIQEAVKQAEESGAIVAYPPTQQGKWGTFAIVIQGDVEHGLRQR